MRRELYRLYRKSSEFLLKQMAVQAYRRGTIDGKWLEVLSLVAAERPSIHTFGMLKGFISDRIILKKQASLDMGCREPIVLCVEKNSLTYMKKFLPYYRKLGIQHFAIIDNVSSDGTAEYLEKQEDVTLYSAPYPFEHHKKAGWLLQAIQEMGIDRWYLRLDADEFLTWEGMEESSIPELIMKMERHGMGTYRAIMADMYPAYSILDGVHDDDCFMDDFVYFDDSSSYSLNSETDEYFGGMRKRTIGTDLRMDKYVIFRPDRGYIPVTNHNMTGVRNEEEKKCRGILRHYKFLPSEGKKYLQISTNKRSGYSGFRQISKYRKLVDGNVNAIFSNSIRYDSSSSIRKLDLIEPL